MVQVLADAIPGGRSRSGSDIAAEVSLAGRCIGPLDLLAMQQPG
jgi:hypothetical protein